MGKKISNKSLLDKSTGSATRDEAPRIQRHAQPSEQEEEQNTEVAERGAEDGDALERADAAEQPKKFLRCNGEELVDHEVDHTLFTYVQQDDVLEPGPALLQAEGDIYALQRSDEELAAQLLVRHMCLWDLLLNYSRNPYMFVYARRPSGTRKHRREGRDLAHTIADLGYFGIPRKDPSIKVWNVEIALPRTFVIQRVITHWLQCIRIIQHRRYPNPLHFWLRPELARRYYTRGAPALWPIQIAEQCERLVLNGWRKQLTDLQDKMLYRALTKKMAKLARATIRAYAWKLMPLCHALDDFLNCDTFTFDLWVIEKLSLQSSWRSGPGFTPRPAWAHRMNLWLR